MKAQLTERARRVNVSCMPEFDPALIFETRVAFEDNRYFKNCQGFNSQTRLTSKMSTATIYVVLSDSINCLLIEGGQDEEVFACGRVAFFGGKY